MPLLNCHVTDETLARLRKHSLKDSIGRTIEQLAEAAIEEAALQAELAQGERQRVLFEN